MKDDVKGFLCIIGVALLAIGVLCVHVVTKRQHFGSYVLRTGGPRVKFTIGDKVFVIHEREHGRRVVEGLVAGIEVDTNGAWAYAVSSLYLPGVPNIPESGCFRSCKEALDFIGLVEQ